MHVLIGGAAGVELCPLAMAKMDVTLPTRAKDAPCRVWPCVGKTLSVKTLQGRQGNSLLMPLPSKYSWGLKEGQGTIRSTLACPATQPMPLPGDHAHLWEV